MSNEKEIKRYIDDEPQSYRVVGFLVRPQLEKEFSAPKMEISKRTPLDVTPYFSQMVHVTL